MNVPPISRIRGLGFAPTAAAHSAIGAAPAPRVGWTAPTLIYDKMRELQGSAAMFDADVRRNVSDPAFQNAWNTWYADWRRFFERYQSDWSKLGAVFYTDDLNATVDNYRLQFANLVGEYSRIIQPQGAPDGGGPFVPPSLVNTSSPAGSVQRFEAQPGTGWSLSWWFWFVAGAGAVGVGLWALNRYAGVGRGAPVGARDPNAPPPDPYYYKPTASRDPDAPIPRELPMSLEEAASHPRAVAYVYRPYEHPHVVPPRETETTAYGREEAYHRPLPPPGYGYDE